MKQILDHGFVRHIESWGYGDAKIAEAGIIEAARQSTQGSFRGWELDQKLLSFLHDNKHDSPFEFAGMIIELQAPIFVFREWHRHRTQSYNEMSARYAALPDNNYIPSLIRMMFGVGKNKQAGTIQGSLVLTEEKANQFINSLISINNDTERLYQWGLENGVPKELARLCIPVNRYSKMRASANLRNWLGFLTLRMDPAAQWEIRQYAIAVGEIIAVQFPRTWDLFQERREKSNQLKEFVAAVKELAKSEGDESLNKILAQYKLV